MLALDANVVIDLARGHDAVRLNFRRTLSATPMWISVFVLQELLFGVHRHAQPERERARLAPLLANLQVLAFEQPDAIVGVRTRASMEMSGVRAPLGAFIVGVHALARGCRLVTANIRHFENIPGLELLDWRRPPGEPQDTRHG